MSLPQLANNLMVVLSAIRDGMKSDDGYKFANPKNPIIGVLTRDGLIVSDATIVNPADGKQIAYWLSVKGLEYFPEEAEIEAETEAEAEEKAFDFSAPAPKASRGRGRPRGPRVPKAPLIVTKPAGRFASIPAASKEPRLPRSPKTEKYPFADLEAPNAEGYDSFFVEANDDIPNPARALGGNVSKANKKYPDRHFVIRFLETDPEFGIPGARVYRDK